MKTILFQGDSITDVFRSREFDNNTGMGYARLVHAEVGYNYPEQYVFLNRGMGGHRSVDLYARIKRDILNLKPDIMSILIGVNDVWQEITDSTGVDADRYLQIYSMIIEETKAALPDIKIMILEPFVVQGSATTEHWDCFRSEVELRAKIAKEISEKYGLVFVPLQKKFDELTKKASPEYWVRDGVHPTAMGHHLIKEEWIKAFETLK